MPTFKELMKKQHVRKHPLFVDRNKHISNYREGVKKHSQDLLDDELDNEVVDKDDIFHSSDNEFENKNDNNLPDIIRKSIKLASETLNQFDFPIPPEVRYLKTKNVKYSRVDENKVISAITVLNAKIATISGANRNLEIPVSTVDGDIIPPSMVIHNGRMSIIAQSTIDEITQRATSYELHQPRGMYAPPLSKDEREIALTMRNEIGWQPRDVGGLVPDYRRSGKRHNKATSTPSDRPGAYPVVVEKMQEALEEGKDSFPRSYQYLLRNYILECVNTVDRDSWEVHLINDGWCINQYSNRRRRGQESDINEVIVEGIARALYVDLWMNEMEEAGLAKGWSGMDVMDLASETSPEAYEKAKELYKQIEESNDVDLEFFVPPGEDENEFNEELLGHYLTLEALGHGVSWSDDHEDHGLKIPSTEYYGDSKIEEEIKEKLGGDLGNKEAQESDSGLAEYLKNIIILKGAVEVGMGVDMSDEPIYVGVVHDGSGFNPGAAVYVDQNKFHASEDSVLEGAFELLEEVQRDQMSEDDFKRLEEDALGYDMYSEELMTETFDGRAFLVSPEELKSVINGLDGINKDEMGRAVEFFEEEWY